MREKPTFRGGKLCSNESYRERMILRALRAAAAHTPPWKSEADKAYIVDLAFEAGVTVEEAAPVLVAQHKQKGDVLSRLDLVAAADPKKLRQSHIETGAPYGAELVRLPALLKRKNANGGTIAIGDRVRVLPGSRHASEHDTGTVTIVDGRAVGVLFDGADEVHRWYVPTELEVLQAQRMNGGYYVWVIGKDGKPLLEGPYGPHELTKAKQLARIGATEGKHNRAVSRGVHPTDKSFEIVREYEAGSGERVL